MEKKEIVRRNLDLLAELMKYANEHPEILDSISPGAELVILPLDDKELYSENQKMIKEFCRQNKPTAVIKFQKPKPIKPQIELVGV